MKSSKQMFTLVAVMVVISMLLSSCGGTTANPTDTAVPAAAATNTPAAAAPTDTAASAAPTNTAGAAAAGDVIKIAVDLPVSGGDATDGIPTRNGMQLAIDQANKAGGVTIAGKTYKLAMYALDDVPPGGQAHDPAQGSKNADSFIADPAVMVMLGPFNSSVAQAMMPKLNTAGLCNISPANTNETLTKPEFGKTKDYRPTGNVTYFRVVTTDDVQGPAEADYAFNKLGLKKVYILDDTEAYGKGIADNFEKQFKKDGGTVLGHDGVPKNTTDYSSILTKIAATKPDFIYYGGTSSNNIPLARKQMKSAGLSVPMMGGDGIEDEQFIKVAGADAEGAYSSVAAVNVTKLPEAQQFITDYNAAGFKEALGAYSGPGYETASIAIDALKRATAATRDGECVALRNTKDFKGVLGTTTFDANGDTSNKVISFYQVKSGKWTFVDQLTFAGTTGGGGTTPANTPAPAAGSFTGDTIKIAVDLPVSGGDATDGIPTRNGMQLAIDQANKAGGVTIAGKTYKLAMYALDDVPPGGQAHDPAQGSKNADSFIADPAVMVMLGPFNSSVAQAMMPKLNTAGLCNISPANTNETLTKPEFGKTKDYRPTGNVTYFRVVTTDDVQGPAEADYAFNKLGLKKVYILDDTEAYGKGIADNFEKQFKKDGGTVLGHDGVPKNTTDYSSILTKIAATKPDFIYYGGTSSNNIPLARKQMKSAGLSVPMMGGDGIEDEQFIKVAGADAEGAYSSVAAVNVTKLPEAQQFITDYNAAGFKEALGAYSGPGYETASIAIDALKRATAATRDGECVALRNTKDFKGVLGTTTFDANGDTSNKVISFYQVKSGKWTFVDQLTFGQ
jgi:branched-chain amino acid transport system substrate-binding protein